MFHFLQKVMTSSILLMNEGPSLKVKKVIPSLIHFACKVIERRRAFTLLSLLTKSYVWWSWWQSYDINNPLLSSHRYQKLFCAYENPVMDFSHLCLVAFLFTDTNLQLSYWLNMTWVISHSSCNLDTLKSSKLKSNRVMYTILISNYS